MRAAVDETVVIVGGTGAMGEVITRRLAQAGWRVVVVARRQEMLAKLVAQVPGVVSCVADIGDDRAIAAIHAALKGSVRMVVQGAGVPTAGGVLEAPTSALVDAVNIKVGGMLRLVRAVDGQLQAGARLVAIAGHYGLEPTAYAAAAGVANAALFNVMRQLSLACGARGITAHTLAPGPADTERLHRVAADRARLQGTTPEAVLDAMRADSSIGQLTTPAQVAWAVALLLDPEADVLTGSTLMLDAGRRHGLP